MSNLYRRVELADGHVKYDPVDDEIERLRLGLVAITDETITDIGELRNIAREYLGWPARDYRT